MLDSDDEQYIQDMLKETITNYLKLIEPRLKEVFRINIQLYLYDVYEPKVWHRENRLLDSITSHFDNNSNTLYISSETQQGIYFSKETGEDVSRFVPDWVMVTGHNDDSSIMNQYHHYQARQVLDMTEKQMKEEFPDIDIKFESNLENLI